jgi:ubiquinone/menaquinone biosynthesis C-methylase UbiE
MFKRAFLSMYNNFVRPKFINKRYIKPALDKQLNSISGRILDFGCGTGCNSFMFSPEFYVGVDIDEDRVGFAKSRNIAHIYLIASGSSLPFKDNCFNYVFICGVLHHLSDHELVGCFKELCRVIKPRGRFVVMEPCLTDSHLMRNWIMKAFDKGNFIKDATGYMEDMCKFGECEVAGYFKTPNLYYTIVINMMNEKMISCQM